MNRSSSKFLACIAVAMLSAAAACTDVKDPSGPPLLDIVQDGPVRPVVEGDVGVPGQGLAVVFHNTVDEVFVFNPCERVTERRVGETWTRMPDELRMCNAMGYLLRANGERREIVDVPGDLTPGEYRFVFTMRAQDRPALNHFPASTSFEVR